MGEAPVHVVQVPAEIVWGLFTLGSSQVLAIILLIFKWGRWSGKIEGELSRLGSWENAVKA